MKAVLIVVVFCALFAAYQAAPLPSSFSWQSRGVVGPVENQGQCGSSDIYAIVNSVASAYAITENAPFASLPIEQVANCSHAGCDGGFANQIWRYIAANGIDPTLPAGECPHKSGVCIKGSACVQDGNETALAYALMANGPIVVNIDASDFAFEEYSGGIYDPSSCSSTDLDHSLLLVGFNEAAWICQNTWGTDWGMGGYILMARNKNNECGIASNACYPVGANKC